MNKQHLNHTLLGNWISVDNCQDSILVLFLHYLMGWWRKMCWYPINLVFDLVHVRSSLVRCLKGHKSRGALLSLGVFSEWGRLVGWSEGRMFFWSGHVSSFLWSDVSIVTSLLGHSLYVKSKSTVSDRVSESVSDRVTYWAVLYS